jgi:glycosyltransferase involved in cell wall biosynthesis
MAQQSGPQSERPSVSVVIAVRDGARYLADALRSVAEQSEPPDDVVVVDDGSSDRSAEVAAEAYPGAHVIRQPPRGYGSAVNRGVRNARGDVLAFLDADDMWPSDSLSCRLTRLTAGAVDAVVGLTRNFLSPDVAHDEATRFRFHERPLHAELLGATIVRAEAFRQVGFLDEGLRTGAAIDWVSRARRDGVRVAYLDDIVLDRRIHGSNLGLAAPDARNAELLRIVRAHHLRHHAS